MGSNTFGVLLLVGMFSLPIIVFSVFVRWARARRVVSAERKGEARVVRGSEIDDRSLGRVTKSGEELNSKRAQDSIAVNSPEIDATVPLFLGDVPVQRSAEAQHFLFGGATGTGKTQGINRILEVARARGARVLVADPGGGSLSRFFRPGDRILNPLDVRTAKWSVFAELRESFDCARIAKSIVPDVVGDAQEWHHYAQTLVSELLLGMWNLEQSQTSKFLRLLTAAPSLELKLYLSDTPAEIFCHEGNEKLLANTRAIIGAYLPAWKTLSDDGQFSVRDWIRTEDSTSWLFVTYRDDQFAMLRPLVATWLDLAIVEALALDEHRPREIWFVMDEVDSLGKIAHLGHALTKLRKYGCRCVLGLQTISQLRATYGRDEAQTLMSNVGTKLVLRAGDGETAEYFSSEFGNQEVKRIQLNSSLSTGSQYSKTEGETEISETKRTVLDSEIASLKDLHGYLKMPGSLYRVKLDYRQWEPVSDAFVATPNPKHKKRSVAIQ